MKKELQKKKSILVEEKKPFKRKEDKKPSILGKNTSIIRAPDAKAKAKSRAVSTSTSGIVDTYISIEFKPELNSNPLMEFKADDLGFRIRKNDKEIPSDIVQIIFKVKDTIKESQNSFGYRLQNYWVMISLILVFCCALYLATEHRLKLMAYCLIFLVITNLIAGKIKTTAVNKLKDEIRKIIKDNSAILRGAGFRSIWAVKYYRKNPRTGNGNGLYAFFELRKRLFIQEESLLHHCKIMNKIIEKDIDKIGKGDLASKDSQNLSSQQENPKKNDNVLVTEPCQKDDSIVEKNLGKESVKKVTLNIDQNDKEQGDNEYDDDFGDEAINFVEEFDEYYVPSSFRNKTSQEDNQSKESDDQNGDYKGIDITVNGQELECFPTRYRIRNIHHKGF